MSESEELASEFALRWIRSIDFSDMRDWLGDQLPFNISMVEFQRVADGVEDAIERIESIEFRKS